MTPTTISELAKEHKKLTRKAERSWEVSDEEYEIMRAVDLVLEGIAKLGKRKKEMEAIE